MHWNGGWWHMGGVWLGWLLVLLLVVAVIWLLVRIAGGGGRRGGRPVDAGSPEEILERRYAQGEIDHVEYERRLADLRR